MYSLINVNNRNKYGIFGGDMFGFTYVRMVKGEWSNTASPQNYTGSGCWTKKKKRIHLRRSMKTALLVVRIRLFKALICTCFVQRTAI